MNIGKSNIPNNKPRNDAGGWDWIIFVILFVIILVSAYAGYVMQKKDPIQNPPASTTQNVPGGSTGAIPERMVGGNGGGAGI